MAASRSGLLLLLVLPIGLGCAPEQPPTFDLARYDDWAADLKAERLAPLARGTYRNGRVLPVYLSDGGSFEFLDRVWTKMSRDSRATSSDDVGTLAVVGGTVEHLSSMGFLELSATVALIDLKAKVLIDRTPVWRSWWADNGQGTVISREQVNKNNDEREKEVAAFLSRLIAH